MFDLVTSDASAAIVGNFYASNKLMTGICHGPAVFSHLKAPDTERSMLDGHKVTGVSNLECETLFPLTGIVEPFSVEDELNMACKGRYEKADKPFEGHVVVSKGPDGRTFITGQNPASGKEFGKAILNQLNT